MSIERRDRLRPEMLWASGLGLGYLPKAPGTWGSIGAVLIWWWLLAPLSVETQLLICAGYFLTGWWCSSRVAAVLGVEDAGEIVADEIVGMWLALVLLPALWWLVLLAFGMFRWLDIAKPGPIGWLDREVKGGLGVMLDDLLAGLITATVLYFSFSAIQSMGFTLS